MEGNGLSAAGLRHAAGTMATYESFSRALMQHILSAASDGVEKRERISPEGDSVAIDLHASVQSIAGSSGCIRVCIRGAGCFVWCPPKV